MEIEPVRRVSHDIACDEGFPPVYQVSWIVVRIAQADEIVFGENLETVVFKGKGGNVEYVSRDFSSETAVDIVQPHVHSLYVIFPVGYSRRCHAGPEHSCGVDTDIQGSAVRNVQSGRHESQQVDGILAVERDPVSVIMPYPGRVPEKGREFPFQGDVVQV